jgi:hypothetical protein
MSSAPRSNRVSRMALALSDICQECSMINLFLSAFVLGIRPGRMVKLYGKHLEAKGSQADDNDVHHSANLSRCKNAPAGLPNPRRAKLDLPSLSQAPQWPVSTTLQILAYMIQGINRTTVLLQSTPGNPRRQPWEGSQPAHEPGKAVHGAWESCPRSLGKLPTSLGKLSTEPGKAAHEPGKAAHEPGKAAHGAWESCPRSLGKQ